MKPYTDHEAYDRLTDELATTDPLDRAHRRPSDFPTVAAFVAATTVARTDHARATRPACVGMQPGPVTLDRPDRALSSHGPAIEDEDDVSSRPAHTPDGS